MALTPLHTIDVLRQAIRDAKPQPPAGNKFVNIDTRVLEWLLVDSLALHRTEAQAAE